MSERPTHHRGGGRGGAGERGGFRGGRGGDRGGRGGSRGGGDAGSGGDRERPKKENILDLAKYMDKEITVKFNGGREGELGPALDLHDSWLAGLAVSTDVAARGRRLDD
jgi:U6 snRNA-associated Sm-like protein LSm7